ncbi:MAG TPA: YqiA/YcfP family alpha/beta fold hydrolase [Azoarcus sp.]|nr:YqiA/YcfP family alpha/beta fold hydrolase [Azoarcus sp.]
MIIYLHGFRSAPASHKAQSLQRRMSALGLGEAFWCEQLPHVPSRAITLIERAIVEARQRFPDTPPTLIGSSLGGYYATFLAERHTLRAVVVNPAVLAPLTLEPWTGRQTNLYTGEVFDFTPAHVAELRALDVPRISDPARYWLLAEKGDEVLDWRHAEAKYHGARQTILEGGDHGFSRWTEYLDEIIAFARLTP